MFRSLAIFCYIIAFAALQAHNAIPHHHEEVGQYAHQDTDHHDDGDHHNSPVSDQDHDAEFGKSLVKPEALKNLADKPVYSCGQFILLFDKLEAFYKSTPKSPPCYKSILYAIFLSHDVPLRAPPSALAISLA